MEPPLHILRSLTLCQNHLLLALPPLFLRNDIGLITRGKGTKSSDHRIRDRGEGIGPHEGSGLAHQRRGKAEHTKEKVSK